MPPRTSAASGYRQPSNLLSRTTIRVLGAYAIVQGVGVVVGGPARWAGPAYTVLRRVPNATQVWGWSAVAIGILVLAGSIAKRFELKAVGLFGLSAWSFSISVGFFASVYVVPSAGTSGGPAHLALALVAIPVLFVDERRTDRWAPDPAATSQN